MARKISVEILGDSSSLVNAFRRSSRESSRWNSNISKAGRGSIVAALGFSGLGRSVAFASGAFVGGAGLTAALKASIEGFSKFEDQMQRTVGLANVAQGSVGKFSKAILALAPQVGKGPQELANAFFFVASSGIKAAKAMEVVNQAARASIAGLGDTAVVSDALTSVINAYGAANISAAQAADVLTATVREGKGEASQFAPVIGNVVALASQLGVSFDQVGAALAVQTRLGTDAETTAIQLQRVFSTLLKVTPKSAEAFESVGLSADDLRETLGEKNGLIKVLTLVRAAFGNNTKALANAFGDVRALRGILNLVGKQTKQTTEVFDKLAHSAGSAKIAFDAVSKDTAQQFRKLKASAQVMGIALGAIFAPIAGQIAGALTVASNQFTKFVNKIQAAKGFDAKISIVTTGLVGLGDRLGRDLLRELGKIDFAEAGHTFGEKTKELFDTIRAKFETVNWGEAGRIIMKKLFAFLRNIDWVGFFKSSILLTRTVMRSVGLLFEGMAKELIIQFTAGLIEQGKIALLYVEKFALTLVKKLAGATSFLGHWDPFAGVKEKAARRLEQIQSDIDKLRGKTIEIKIVTKDFSRDTSNIVKPKPTTTKSGASGTEDPVIDQAAIAAAKAASAAKRAAAVAKKAKEKAAEAFQDVVGAFSLAREKADATKSLQDDLKVEKAFQVAILREIQIEGKTVALQQELFTSIQNVAEINKQIAEAKRDAVKKSQFIALGLTASGDERLAGNKTLLKRTNNLRDLIKGTPLDTGKTISQLNRISRILKGAFGKVGRDVRQAIVDMLNDIKDGLAGGGSKGPLTATHGLNTKQIVAGLGLGEDQIRELRSRLSGFNTGGRALGGSAGPASRSATSAPARTASSTGKDGIFVTVDVPIYLDGQRIANAVTKQQQKNKRRNPQQKRGPHRK